MGEGRWVEVRAADGHKGEKAVKQLRKMLAAEEFLTQESSPKGAAIAVAGGTVPGFIAVLRSWLKRWGSPERVRLTLGEESLDVQRSAFDEQTIKAFLIKHH